MRHQKTDVGYTIVEVLIFIAITSLMFVMAAVSFGGRQSEVQFSQAVRDFDSKFQDLVNDVSTGYYPNDGDVECTLLNPTDANERPFPDTSGSDTQGTSDICIALGKVLQFNPAGEDASTIHVYNILGRRNNQNSRPVDSLQEARPVATNNFSAENLSWGLRVTRIYQDGTDYGAIGLFTSFSKSFNSGGISESKISNNEKVRYATIPSSSLNEAGASLVSTIGTITDVSPDAGGATVVYPDNPPEITICLQNALETKRASIIVGGDGSTSTEVQFDNYDRTVCDP